MSFLFGPKKTPEEQMREYKRTIDRSCRELDRERTNLERQEKKIITDLKKTAKAGQMGPVKIMAKDLVRTRKYIQKFYQMRCQLQAVGLRLQTMKSTASMTDAMKGATKCMMAMNQAINLPQMQKIMQEFEKQSELMDMKQEMMNDTIDEVMEDESTEAEEEEIISQVLDAIGISLDGQLGAVPQGTAKATAAAARPVAATENGGPHSPHGNDGPAASGGGGGLDDDLEARLNRLRNG